jgi:peptidoglycan/LPS O-acetylase OafA/YrhL
VADAAAAVGNATPWSFNFFPSTVCFFLMGHFARVVADRLEMPAAFGFAFLAAAIFLMLRYHATFSQVYYHLALVSFAASLPGIFAATRHSRVLNALGELSYPVYLVHQVLIFLLFNAAGHFHVYGQTLLALGEGLDPITRGQLITVAFAAHLILACTIVHIFVEQPLRRALIAAMATARSRYRQA